MMILFILALTVIVQGVLSWVAGAESGITSIIYSIAALIIAIRFAADEVVKAIREKK